MKPLEAARAENRAPRCPRSLPAVPRHASPRLCRAGLGCLASGALIFSFLLFSGEDPLKGPCLLGCVFLCYWKQRPGL